MPKSVNKVILLGNVGKDPEVKFLPSGLPVANLTLATSERFKDKSGEWQDKTEWHNLTAYQRLAEIMNDCGFHQILQAFDECDQKVRSPERQAGESGER